MKCFLVKINLIIYFNYLWNLYLIKIKKSLEFDNKNLDTLLALGVSCANILDSD